MSSDGVPRRHRAGSDALEGTRAVPASQLRPLPSLSYDSEDGVGDSGHAMHLAMHAALVLSHKRASLADVYAASAALVPPSLVHLADRCEKAVPHPLRAMLATEYGPATGLATVLRRESAFHRAVMDALGSPTLCVLSDMLQRIIECAATRVSDDRVPGIPPLAEVGTHHNIVSLVEAGRGHVAASLAWVRAAQVEELIRGKDIAIRGLSYDILGGY